MVLKKEQCLEIMLKNHNDKQKKMFKVRSLLYYEELSQVSSSCKLHLLKLHPKPSLNTKIT